MNSVILLKGFYSYLMFAKVNHTEISVGIRFYQREFLYVQKSDRIKEIYFKISAEEIPSMIIRIIMAAIAVKFKS